MVNKITPVLDETEARLPRGQDTREKESRIPTTFVPASLLPELESKDPDYVYRWIRASSLGKSDTANVSSRMREGWVPVKLADMPELLPYPDPNSKFPENIEQGGLLLCKAPKELVAARRKYYADKNSQQIKGVENNFFRENDKRMPLFREHQTKVTNTG